MNTHLNTHSNFKLIKYLYNKTILSLKGLSKLNQNYDFDILICVLEHLNMFNVNNYVLKLFELENS